MVLRLVDDDDFDDDLGSAGGGDRDGLGVGTGDAEPATPPLHRTRGAQIEIRGVSRRFRQVRGAPPVLAVRDLTLSIPAGQTVALTGPSGSGKSTVLDLIGAHGRPDTGTITVDDTAVESLSGREAARFRQRIGVVSQDSELMAALTAVDNVVFPLLYQPVEFDRQERALELLAAVGLSRQAEVRPTLLSAGQRQRVVIARALANHPTLLLADEPTARLDGETAAEILDLLSRMAKTYGTTMLLATHDDAVAVRCQRVIGLRDGELVSDHSDRSDQDATRRWIGRSAPLL